MVIFLTLHLPNSSIHLTMASISDGTLKDLNRPIQVRRLLQHLLD